MGDAWVEEAWQRVNDKIARTSKRIGPAFPHASVNGKYVLEEPQWWTAGFWPGLLWLLYRESGDNALKTIAEQCEDRLDEVLIGFDTLDHDIGFMWTLTSVARYKLLGDARSRRRALMAANLLAGRFNVNGRYIRAWNTWENRPDNRGWAIIDCLMNLGLLFWASEETGDPRTRHVAVQHAETTLAHFVRPDGSVHHIVTFDPESGERIGAEGGQGFAPESAWSRGTAWAIYGFAICYRYTGIRPFLDAAKRTAHFFLAHLPEDEVPVWDFRLPPDVTPYRDSSAGACAASGLLEIAGLVPETEREMYRIRAERILASLYRRYGAWDDAGEEGLLLHGTSHYPEQRNLDVPLIYGDYFFVEGLSKLRGQRQTFW